MKKKVLQNKYDEILKVAELATGRKETISLLHKAEKIRSKINTALKKNINRQSLVIFKPPQQLIAAGYDENSALIKRVIGLPGVEIEVHDGKLFLNKLIIKEPGIKEPMLYEMDPVIVPNNSLWVLGDNRNNSLDSHIWGALPQKNVIGIAIFRYWPLKKLGVIRFPSL